MRDGLYGSISLNPETIEPTCRGPAPNVRPLQEAA